MVDIGGGLVEQALIVLKGWNKQQSLMHSIVAFAFISQVSGFWFSVHLIGRLFCFGQFMSDG